MNKYSVYVLEIHQVEIQVDAYDEDSARKEALNGNGMWVDNSMQLVDSVDHNEWQVEMIEEGV